MTAKVQRLLTCLTTLNRGLALLQALSDDGAEYQQDKVRLAKAHALKQRYVKLLIEQLEQHQQALATNNWDLTFNTLLNDSIQFLNKQKTKLLSPAILKALDETIEIFKAYNELYLEEECSPCSTLLTSQSQTITPVASPKQSVPPFNQHMDTYISHFQCLPSLLIAQTQLQHPLASQYLADFPQSQQQLTAYEQWLTTLQQASFSWSEASKNLENLVATKAKLSTLRLQLADAEQYINDFFYCVIATYPHKIEPTTLIDLYQQSHQISSKAKTLSNSVERNLTQAIRLQNSSRIFASSPEPSPKSTKQRPKEVSCGSCCVS